MMDYLGKVFWRWAEEGTDGLEWMLNEMSVTQWAIVGGIFCVAGFLALKTKL
ncbi:MAG: hypothetical protein ACE361_22390 [Aureliella sp.]